MPLYSARASKSADFSALVAPVMAIVGNGASYLKNARKIIFTGEPATAEKLRGLDGIDAVVELRGETS